MNTNDGQLAKSLHLIAEAIETVEAYTADTLNTDGTVDREALEVLPFGYVLNMLEELDGVAAATPADYGQAAFIGDISWMLEGTQEKAVRLARLIRLAVNSPAAHKDMPLPEPKAATAHVTNIADRTPKAV